MNTHYGVLGVAPGADYKTIKAAYRKAVKAYHPDLNVDSLTAERQSKRVIAAYTVLKDPERRAQYDEFLRRRQRRARMFVITLVVTMGLFGGGTLIVLSVLLEPQTKPPLARITNGGPDTIAKKNDFLPPVTKEPARPVAEDAASPGTETPLPKTIPILDGHRPAEDRNIVSGSEGSPAPEQAVAEDGSARIAEERPRIPEAAPSETPPEQTAEARELVEFPDPQRTEASRALELNTVPADGSNDAGDLVTGALREGKDQAPATLAESGVQAATQERPGSIPSAAENGGRPDDAHAARQSETERHIMLAADLANKGDLEKSLAEYDAAIRLDASSIAAFHGRGLLWWRQGDTDRALIDLDQAIRLSFSDPDTYRDRGVMWLERGNYDRAIADLNRAIELKPGFANAYFWRGEAQRRKRNFKDAVSDLDQAVRLAPNLGEARRNLELARMEKSDPAVNPPPERR